jgi:hypothetical protein
MHGPKGRRIPFLGWLLASPAFIRSASGGIFYLSDYNVEL